MATEKLKNKKQETVLIAEETNKLNVPVQEEKNPKTAVAKTKTIAPATVKKASPKPSAKKVASKKIQEKPAAATSVKEENLPALKKEIKVKTAAKKLSPSTTTKLIFQLKFYTKPGEQLFITGNHEIFGNNIFEAALPMQYLNNESWVVSLDVDGKTIPADGVEYNYVIKHTDDSVAYDWGKDKVLTPDLFKYEEVLITDAWNHAGYYNNAFYTEPFQNVLLKNNFTEVKIKQPKNTSHIFKIKAPLLKKGETVCLLGSANETGNWIEENAVLLSRKANEDFHSIALDLSKIDLPLIYKYGIYDTVNKKLIRYEDGSNRILFHAHAAAKK